MFHVEHGNIQTHPKNNQSRRPSKTSLPLCSTWNTLFVKNQKGIGVFIRTFG